MSDKKVLADGAIMDGIVAKRDDKCSNDGDGTAETQDLPRYSESKATTYQKDDVARQLPTRTNGESSKCLNNGPVGIGPVPYRWAQNEMLANLYNHREATATYFRAIGEGDHETITGLLETNAVTTETRNEDGLTPLLFAINAGHIETVRFLLEAGADPNAYGVAWPGRRPRRFTNPPRKHLNPPGIYRTPLQLAAARGSLPIVKLLMETYRADDALVAPDGELALRLAAANGHREIVAYLPARRGGGFRRWKARHDVSIRRAKRAATGVYWVGKFLAYYVPKFFVWYVPKHAVVLPVVRRVKWLYARRAELPRLVVDGLKRLWEGVRSLPGDLWGFVRRIPPFVKTLAVSIRDDIVATIKGIPKAARIAALWGWNGVKILVGVIGKIFDRLFSFLHTVLLAVGTFFRNVTLKNVWDGFVAFVHAVVVEGPRKLWHWMRKFGDVSIEMLKAMWGFWGELLGFLFWSLVKIFAYVPVQLWKILASMLESIGYGGKEILIWINPKR